MRRIELEIPLTREQTLAVPSEADTYPLQTVLDLCAADMERVYSSLVGG